MDREDYLKLNIPSSTVIELTNRCNLRCAHCYETHTRADMLSESDYFTILDDLQMLGCFDIIFSGGEPFLRKELLFKLLKKSKSKGFRTILITNASLCNKSDFEKLLELGLDTIQISLYGMQKNTYKDMCKADVDVKSLLQNIEYAKNLGLDVETQTALTHYNFCDMRAIDQWCRSVDVFNDYITYFVGDESLTKDNLSATLKTKQLLEAFEYKKDSYLKYYCGCKEQEPKKNFCVAGRKKLCISSDGTLFPCPTWRVPIGNVKNGLVESWNKPNKTLKQIRSYELKDFICSECQYFQICAFCPGMNYAENKNVLVPSKYLCEYTKLLCNFCEESVNNGSGLNIK